MPPDSLQLLASAATVMLVVMAGAWLWQRRYDDAGIVDVVWSGSFALLASMYAWRIEGVGTRGVVIAVLVSLWSLRLAVYLLVNRVLGRDEDGRYRALRAAKGDAFQRWLVWFYLAQGASVVVLSIPALVTIADPRRSLGLTGWLGASLLLSSIIGESVADRQLARFRAAPENKGRVCRVGLWRYSRHPNYFFEWLHWMAYPIFAMGGPWWWVPWFAPAVMLFLVLKVTGIPPTEEQAIRSRGDAYRDYQRTTNAFFPWSPRPSSAARGSAAA